MVVRGISWWRPRVVLGAWFVVALVVRTLIARRFGLL
jgi:hypothetical protein